jgi:hypothetical protein
VAIGVRGRADNMVRSLGVLCSNPDATGLAGKGGEERGAPFTLPCPPGKVLAGIQGRAGSLIDAIGIACVPKPDGAH